MAGHRVSDTQIERIPRHVTACVAQQAQRVAAQIAYPGSEASANRSQILLYSFERPRRAQSARMAGDAAQRLMPGHVRDIRRCPPHRVPARCSCPPLRAGRPRLVPPPASPRVDRGARGHPARLYNTLTEVAAAMYPLGARRRRVSAVTGSRRRSLTDAELRDLGRDVRALRLHTCTTSSASPLHPYIRLGHRNGERRKPQPNAVSRRSRRDQRRSRPTQPVPDGRVNPYRYLGTIPSSMGHMIGLENCHSMDLTLWPVDELRALRLRGVTPTLPSPA